MIEDCVVDPKYSCADEEYREICEDILEDLVYRSVDIGFGNMFILHESSIVSLLSEKLRFRASANVMWTSYCVDKVNSGIVGLSMESIYEEKEYMDKFQTFYDEFVNILSSLLLKDKNFKRKIKKIINTCLSERFEDKYKLLSVGGLNFNIGKDNSGSYYPDLVVDFTVRRR
jgi:hypothetical protein